MGIFNNQLIIEKDYPFKGDKLERKAEADKLTNLFELVDNQMVLAINSPWGTGKTTFLKMWKMDLELNNYSTVFFNCWENDFVDEPFIAFIEEIRNSLHNEIIDTDFIEKAKEIGILLFKQVPTIAKKIVKNKTDIDIDDIISNDDLKEFISGKMENYKKSKNSIEKFKIELEKIAKKNLEKTGKPLIIFVDEIDRCRPDFAIKLLERIKHFFNIENIIFILGMDKKALSNSIKVIYGQGTEIEGYLSRFIDLEYKLNNNSRKKFLDFLLQKYKIRDQYIKRDLSNCYENDFKALRKILITCIEITNLSFRDIEKVLVRLIIIIKENEQNILFIYPTVFLLCIRQVDVDLYNRIKNDIISLSEIQKRLRNRRNTDSVVTDEHIGNLLDSFMAILLNDIVYTTEVNQDKNKLSAYTWVKKRVNEWANSYKIRFSKKIIIELIEMYDGIKF